jgi:energy-coupling factor transporter ATP-binding protein EcfA2
MNEILKDPTLWPASAKPVAERRFDPRVVKAFYDDLTPDAQDFFELRDAKLPLPGHDEGYRQVLVVGTTGAGKTTLIRQLIGTDPNKERFPSTSTAKTTVADMEIITSQGDYAAVVTFMPRDEVREYVEDCIAAACAAAHRGAPDREIERRILNHVDQRFRIAYLLGQGTLAAQDVVNELDDEPEPDIGQMTLDEAGFDKAKSGELITTAVRKTKELAARCAGGMRDGLGPVKGEADKCVMEELIEEELDKAVRGDPAFDNLAGDLMKEITVRFETLLKVGSIEKTKLGWPGLWHWSCPDRAVFLRTVSRFSSNYAGFFGELLTPLVNGIRVQGPFKPRWLNDAPRLVLCDTEGLGHTPESSTSLPTRMSQRIEEVDAVLLVDNALQPVQATPIVVLRHMAALGYEKKLVLCFTHFGETRVDNLPTVQAKKDHVFASVENVVARISDDLGQGVGRSLCDVLEGRCFYVGGMQESLGDKEKLGRHTIRELEGLVKAVTTPITGPEIGEARPEYDMANLMFRIQGAASRFHEEWRARLGLGTKIGTSKVHWTRIRALSRRLAMRWADQYDTLQPIADLSEELSESIRQFIENPLRWTPSEPSEEKVTRAIFNQLAQGVGRRIRELVSSTLYIDKVTEWGEAYSYAGGGSARKRSEKIAYDVLDKGAPIPGELASQDVTEFLKAIRRAFKEASEELNIRVY